MRRKMTCILCPNGCRLRVELTDKSIALLEGARCSKGEKFVHQEINDPHRNIASSILVKGGELKLASVRLTAPIPRDKIFDVMATIKEVKCDAPVISGQVILTDVLGLGVDLICTKSVEKA